MDFPKTQSSNPEHTAHCPVCDNANSFSWARSYDRLHRITAQVFHFRSCQACSALFLADGPKKSEVGVFYPHDYAPHNGHSSTVTKKANYFLRILRKACTLPGSLLQYLSNRNSERILSEFYLPSEGLLLDFGCGSAKFLNKAKKMGWDTLGADFNDSTIQDVINSGHRAIKINNNLNEAIEQNSVNLFRLNHVFEHLENPSYLLSIIHRKIKTEGKIVITMPNPEGLSALIFRKYWFSLDCPRHTILYPPPLIRTLVQKAGFKNIVILPEYINKDFSRSVGYWLYQRGYMRPKRATELHSSPFWDLLSTPALVAGLFLQRPDRYHLLATKL